MHLAFTRWATTSLRSSDDISARRCPLYCLAARLGATTCAGILPVGESLAAEGGKPRPVAATDWPQWRGPAGQAVLADDQLAAPWPSRPLRPLWQVRLGTGWSSPVVADGQVFITDRVGGNERVAAFRADTGQEIWQKQHDVDFDPHPVGRRHGNGPKGTPVVDGDKVYSVGIAGRLECREAATGSLVWEVNFPAAFGQHQPLADGKAWVNGTENVRIVPIGNGEGALGAAVRLHRGSPTLCDDLLVTSVRGPGRGGTIMAFGKTSGRVVWKSLTENVSYFFTGRGGNRRSEADRGHDWSARGGLVGR